MQSSNYSTVPERYYVKVSAVDNNPNYEVYAPLCPLIQTLKPLYRMLKVGLFCFGSISRSVLMPFGVAKCSTFSPTLSTLSLKN